MNRRDFLIKGILAAAGTSALLHVKSCGVSSEEVKEGDRLRKLSDTEKRGLSDSDDSRWKEIRSQFSLTDDYIHMSAMLFASHPRAVREAINQYRENLDQDPVLYLQRENRDNQERAREAAARYIGADANDIALTDSTTMGLAIVYQGMQLNAGDEIILAQDDYYSTYESIYQAVQRTGARMVEIDLYSNTHSADTKTLVQKIENAITDATRVVAVTWVHSGTGLKMPVAEISQVIQSANSSRGSDERILLVVDGVHGFGVEDFEVSDLGCDVFIAGCHKWLFGPRGTGIVWANDHAWRRLSPIIPSFIDPRVWESWRNRDPITRTNAALFSPGGFKSFEHLWALPEAFEFHQNIGKKAVAEHTHELANRAKKRLMEMSHISVATPKDDQLSSGIISFDVNGQDPWSVVATLQESGIIASVNPYSSRHVRITPSLYNSAREVDYVLGVMEELG